MSEPKGAVRNGDNWVLTANDEQLLQAEEVIWVEDMFALRAELDDRYPCEDVRLSRLKENYQGYTVYDEPVLKTTDVETAIAVAMERGSIKVLDSYQYSGKYDELLKRGVVLQGSELIFDPKRSKRIIRERAARELKRWVTTADIRRCVWAISRIVTNLGYSSAPMNDCGTRSNALFSLRAGLTMMNQAFGKGSYKRMETFQWLVKEWRLKKEVSGKVFRESGHGVFADFMDGIKRLPKVAPSEKWAAGKKLELFV